jgi:hypothetical protein
MSKSSYPLKLPQCIKEAAQRLAKADGVSLNQVIATAVAEKVGTLNTVDEFLKERVGVSVPDDMLTILDKVPDNEPMQGNELLRKGKQLRIKNVFDCIVSTKIK